jgi:hypothetical protein
MDNARLRRMDVIFTAVRFPSGVPTGFRQGYPHLNVPDPPVTVNIRGRRVK